MSDTPSKCAVLCDNWKLSIFERHLTQAGYQFENAGQFSPGCTTLIVRTTNKQALAQVVLKANQEAAKTGAPK